ncbi:hypothetical protein [Erwinia aphidicola]
MEPEAWLRYVISHI